MKINVKKLYEDDRWSWTDYQPMLNAFGKIVIQVDDDSYSGDSRVLYDENGRIGLLIFGWGSCSGCDALQKCETLKEVQKLCNALQNSIMWFDDKKQAIEYFTNHDWEGDYSYHSAETKEFVNRCNKYLSKRKSVSK